MESKSLQMLHLWPTKEESKIYFGPIDPAQKASHRSDESRNCNTSISLVFVLFICEILTL